MTPDLGELGHAGESSADGTDPPQAVSRGGNVAKRDVKQYIADNIKRPYWCRHKRQPANAGPVGMRLKRAPWYNQSDDHENPYTKTEQIGFPNRWKGCAQFDTTAYTISRAKGRTRAGSVASKKDATLA